MVTESTGRSTGMLPTGGTRSKRSPKTSGFQYIHLFSSTDADDIICWKEESPVFSLTQEIPFGEKMENPDEEPSSVSEEVLLPQNLTIIPIYLVSPQLLVTSEHIISDRASTSSSDFSGVPLLRFSLSPFVVDCSGDATVLRGVDPLPSFCEACDGEAGFDPGAAEALCDSLLSASRFSSVPRSVRPLSSSVRSPT